MTTDRPTTDPTRAALRRLASWDEMAGHGDPSEFPAMYRAEVAARINLARAALATPPAPEPALEWNACIEVRIHASKAAEPSDMQTGEDDDYCMASTRRDGVWNERDVEDPPLCCWRPPDHAGDHHDPFQRLDWRWEVRNA